MMYEHMGSMALVDTFNILAVTWKILNRIQIVLVLVGLRRLLMS